MDVGLQNVPLHVQPFYDIYIVQHPTEFNVEQIWAGVVSEI